MEVLKFYKAQFDAVLMSIEENFNQIDLLETLSQLNMLDSTHHQQEQLYAKLLKNVDRYENKEKNYLHVQPPKERGTYEMSDVGFTTRQSDYSNLSKINRQSIRRPVHLSVSHKNVMAKKFEKLCLLSSASVSYQNWVKTNGNQQTELCQSSVQLYQLCHDVILNGNFEGVLQKLKHFFVTKQFNYFWSLVVMLYGVQETPTEIKMFLMQIQTEQILPPEFKRDFLWICGYLTIESLILQEKPSDFIFEPCLLKNFSQTTTLEIQAYSDFTGHNFLEAQKNNLQISIDTNPQFEELVMKLQQILMSNGGMSAIQSKMTGEEGLKITRATFGVIVQHSPTPMTEFETLSQLWTYTSQKMNIWLIKQRQINEPSNLVQSVMVKSQLLADLPCQKLEKECLIQILTSASITSESILRQIEQSYLINVKRFTAFVLIRNILEQSQGQREIILDVVHWLQQMQQKNLSHYLDGVRYSQDLQQCLTLEFFSILTKLMKIFISESDNELLYSLLYAYQWKFKSIDFQHLLDLNIFEALMQKCEQKIADKSLFNDLILTFKDLFASVLSAVVADQLLTGQQLLKQAVDQIMKGFELKFDQVGVVASSDQTEITDIQISVQQFSLKEEPTQIQTQASEIQSHLVQLLKLFTSVALLNQQLSEWAKELMTPQYVSVIYNLMVDTSNRTTVYRILLIMEDFIQLGLCCEIQLEFYNKFVFDSNNYIISSLYSFAQKCFSKDDITTGHMVIRSIRAVSNVNQLQVHLDQFSSLSQLDQTLILMLCGAQVVRQPVMGDLLINIFTNQSFVMMSDNEPALVFDQNSTENPIFLAKNERQCVRQANNQDIRGVLPTFQITDVLLNIQTCQVTVILLLDFFVRSQSNSISKEMLVWLVDQVGKNLHVQARWVEQLLWKDTVLELPQFQDIGTYSHLKSIKRPRNLIKQLYKRRDTTEKQAHSLMWDYANLYVIAEEECAYYLSEDNLLKQAWLDYQSSDKTVYTSETIKSNKNLSKQKIGQLRDQISEANRLLNTLSTQTVKQKLQSCHPLDFKIEFQADFSNLMRHEIRPQSATKSENQIMQPSLQIQLAQSILQILFQQACQTELSLSDEMLWHLNSYFTSKKYHNRVQGLTKQSLTSTWFKILQKAPESFIQLFIKRHLRSIYLRASYSSFSEYRESLDVYDYSTVQVIGKLLLSSTARVCEFAEDFISALLRQCSVSVFPKKNLSDSQILRQRVLRKNLSLIQKIVEISITDPNIYQLVSKNELLHAFILQGHTEKHRFIKQWSLVARMIELSLFKASQNHKLIKFSRPGQHIQQMLIFEQVIDEKTQIQALKTLFQDQDLETKPQHPSVSSLFEQNLKKPWTEDYCEILQQDFGKWIRVDLNSEFFQTIKVRAVEGFGCGLIAVSDSQEFNEHTIYKMIQTQGNSYEITFDIPPFMKQVYLMFPVFKPFILKFQGNKLTNTSFVEQEFGQAQLINVYDQKLKKEFCFVKQNNNLFVHDGGIYQTYTRFIGFSEQIQSIKIYQDLFVMYNTNNQPFIVRVNEVLQLMKSNYIRTKSNEIVKFRLSKRNGNTLYANTENNTQLVIQVISSVSLQSQQSVNLEITEEGNPPIKTRAVLRINKSGDLTLAGDCIYLKSTSNGAAPDVKVKPILIPSCDAIVYVQTLQWFIIAIGRKIMSYNLQGVILNTNNMPDDVVSVYGIHYLSHRSTDGTIKDEEGSPLIFFQVVKKNSMHALYQNDKLKFEQIIDKIQFKLIKTCEDKCFGIDTKGEVWQMLKNCCNPQMKAMQTTALDLWIQCNSKEFYVIVETQQQITQKRQERSFFVVPYDSNIRADLCETVFLEQQLADVPDNLGFYRYSNQYQFQIAQESHIDFTFLVENSTTKIFKLQYKISGRQQADIVLNYEDLQKCKDLVNSRIKVIMSSDLCQDVWVKKVKLASLIDLKNVSGLDPDHVRLVITANQFIIDQKEYSLALAHSQQLPAAYQKFLEKFAAENVLYSVHAFRFYGTKGMKYPVKNIKVYRLDDNQKSLFEQLFSQTMREATKIYSSAVSRREYDYRPIKVRFIGERSYDAGGPFKDLFEQVCNEILLKFFKPTANNLFFENASYQPIYKQEWDQQDLQRLIYVGKMIGWSLSQQTLSLTLDLNIVFWKKLINIQLTFADLKQIDQYRYETLKKFLLGEKIFTTFVADLGSGLEQELCHDGMKVHIETPEDCKRFVDLYLEKYFSQHDVVYDCLIYGIRQICPDTLIKHLTPDFAAVLAFSQAEVSAEAFIAAIKTGNVSNTTTFEMFKQMIREFNNCERQQLLKFITASSRLQPDQEIEVQILDQPTSDYLKHDIDANLPVAHTCGDQIDIPVYSCLSIMMSRFRTAMTMCGEIDYDHSMNSVNDEDSEDDYGDYDSSDDEVESSSDSSNQNSNSHNSRSSDSYYSEIYSSHTGQSQNEDILSEENKSQDSEIDSPNHDSDHSSENEEKYEKQQTQDDEQEWESPSSDDSSFK